MDAAEIKVCTICKQAKAIDEFKLTHSRGKPYRRAWCNVCLGRYYKIGNVDALKQEAMAQQQPRSLSEVTCRVRPEEEPTMKMQEPPGHAERIIAERERIQAELARLEQLPVCPHCQTVLTAAGLRKGQCEACWGRL